MQIIDVKQAKGHVHDFHLYKETIGSAISSGIAIQADSGYQGIREYHHHSLIPYKSSKNRELQPLEKVYNRLLSRERIRIEHINRELKVFKIMSYPYRNRRKRHLLRMTLFSAIHNYEIQQTNS